MRATPIKDPHTSRAARRLSGRLVNAARLVVQTGPGLTNILDHDREGGSPTPDPPLQRVGRSWLQSLPDSTPHRAPVVHHPPPRRTMATCRPRVCSPPPFELPLCPAQPRRLLIQGQRTDLHELPAPWINAIGTIQRQAVPAAPLFTGTRDPPLNRVADYLLHQALGGGRTTGPLGLPGRGRRHERQPTPSACLTSRSSGGLFPPSARSRSFLYIRQVTDSLTESFISSLALRWARANGTPGGGVLRHMSRTALLLQSWMWRRSAPCGNGRGQHVSSEVHCNPVSGTAPRLAGRRGQARRPGGPVSGRLTDRSPR